ncbi:MAG: FliA/WhiG family RNA polymerase sigma factor [Fusobacteria bacterium]|nr:FliA/WhiG family RNA polymerase sigma factor [Fusobacteriota bacterium]
MIEDKDLWLEYKKNGSLEIRETLVLKYIPLVKYVVGKIIVNLPNNVEYEDLVEYGIIGLLDAINKFDVTKNINFKTYAVTRVRGSIYDELRVQDWVPRSVRKTAKDIERAYIEIERKTGRSATEEEVCELLNITIKELNDTFSKVSMGNISSLDDIVYDGGESKTELVDTLEDVKAENPQENLEKDELKKALVEKLMELSEKERMVITLYYHEDLTLREIGTILDISESRVSQIHSKTVMKLRAKLVNKFKNY